MRYLQIMPDGQVNGVECNGLADLQAGVGGGYITGVYVTQHGLLVGEDVTGYANDEGLLIGMPYNTRASLMFGQDLVGPILVGGAINSEGNTTALTPMVEEKVRVEFLVAGVRI